MPIIKTEENNIQIIFGVGDILVSSGMMGDYEQGLIAFTPQKPKPIGTFEKPENPVVEMSDIPFSLIFQNVDSLDVVIERLGTVRKYMTGELDIKNEID